MPSGASSMQWLSAAAARAGITELESFSLAPGALISDSWRLAAEVACLPAEELARRLAPAMQIAVADLLRADPSVFTLVPERLARKHHVFPLREVLRTIVVATSDPHDMDAEHELGFASGRRVVFELASPADIADAIEATFPSEPLTGDMLDTMDGLAAETVSVVEDAAPVYVTRHDIEATPIVRMTNLVLHDAVEQGASDIHIESAAGNTGIVRFRVDGVLRQYMTLPPAAVIRVVSRIKVLGKLDIADRLRPQDGRARIQVDTKAYDLRISTVPTHDAEKAVIRILRPDALPTLDQMHIDPRDDRRLRRLLTYRNGIVVVTGPTGSGKTTTLYAAIKELATTEVNVMTVEDPVEYDLAGITQMQVDLKKGVTFASALRSILRQDPDVILVGEIRDAETASIAAEAAMTGHLVLATLHTNEAMSAVTRLTKLGLDRAIISATLRGVVAQRLIRRVCASCAAPVGDLLTADEIRLSEHLGTQPTMRAVGCRRCGKTGYHGRIPIHEIALVTPRLAEAIGDGASAQQLQRLAARNGMRRLRESALERVVAGVTTLHEVDRVLGEAAEGNPEPDVADAETTEAGGYTPERTAGGDENRTAGRRQNNRRGRPGQA